MNGTHMDQTMSGETFDAKVKPIANEYARQIAYGILTLMEANSLLVRGNLDLFHTAALAKATACFQCG